MLKKRIARLENINKLILTIQYYSVQYLLVIFKNLQNSKTQNSTLQRFCDTLKKHTVKCGVFAYCFNLIFRDFKGYKH